MSYTQLNYDAVDAVGDGLHFLRDPLDCEQLGVSVLECEPGYEGKPHDHAQDGQEEVYVCVEGDATVTVDGEDVAMEAGDALRLSPDAERRITNDDGASKFVLVGAP